MLVIGAGPAGLKAAAELARRGFKTEIVKEGDVTQAEWVVPPRTLKLLPDKNVIVEKYPEGMIKQFPYGAKLLVKGKFLLLDRARVMKSLKEEAKSEGAVFTDNPVQSMKTIVATGSSTRKFSKAFYCYGFWVDKQLVDLPTVEISSMKHGFFIYPHGRKTFISVWHTSPTPTYAKELHKRAGVKPLQVQSGVIPVEMKKPEEDNKLFVGDALSAATPVMGEGLRPALLSSIIAAKALSTGGNYAKLLKKEFGFAYRFSAFMRDKLWDLPPEKINMVMKKLNRCNPKVIDNLIKTKTTRRDVLSIGLRCPDLLFSL
ncbi:MAG: FAD-dependent oxidoreductase [Candidatus Diapherotrites archaeon]|nr:FAD-dependent oxidoreductase [Candidatus Diapherotrites archaeon]